MQYASGQRVAPTCPPMILTRGGVQVGGCWPPAALRETRDKLAAERPQTAAAGKPPGA